MKISSYMLGLIVIASLLSLPARADESEVEYDTQTGYIRAVRLISVTPPQAPRAPQQRAARANAAPMASAAAEELPPTQPGILRVQHPTGATPDSVRQKVDLAAMALVQNDRLTTNVDFVVLRAGSGESKSVQLTKCSPDGSCIVSDSSPIWVSLVPIVNGERALPGTSLGGIPPRGRILSLPPTLSNGRGTITIRAADQPGEDVLMIAQPGIEPRFVQVRYE